VSRPSLFVLVLLFKNLLVEVTMGLNSARRTKTLRQSAADKGLDGLLISQPENRFYTSGFSGSAGYLFVTPNLAVLATDFRYVEQSRLQAPDYEVFQISGKVEEWFPKLVGQAGLNRLGFESDNVSVAFARQLSDALAKAGLKIELVPVDGLVEAIRVIKEAEEIGLISKAVKISDQAMTHIIAFIQAGMTEKAVAWEIEKYMREHDSQSVPFEVLVQSGPNSALPHAQPSDRRIGVGEPVVMDIGAKVGWYASDLTRTICVGKPDGQFKKIYDTVLGAQLAAIALIKQEMTGDQADGFARIVIKESGHGNHFGHSLGHGVGLAVHEAPRLGPNSTDVLKNGMVFSIEPGIYLPGWGGVRIEDLAMLEEGKIKVLSSAPKIGK
jgi:Xaa-Pro aminopeptidase